MRNPTTSLPELENLVVKNADDDDFLWQIFDYPCDTLLHGMSLGWNYTTGVESYLSSWSTEGDPAPGRYTAYVDPHILIKYGETIKNRMGPWNGITMSGAPDVSIDPMYVTSLERSTDMVMYREDSHDQSLISRSVVTIEGETRQLIWNSQLQTWTVYRRTVSDPCDAYDCFGVNAYCDGNSPFCRCLYRFVPNDPESWRRSVWSGGCVRRVALNCLMMFLRYSEIKLADARNCTIRDEEIVLEECEAECKRNCSCTGYTRVDISGEERGCLFYHRELIDIRTLLTGGQDLYIRLAFSESFRAGSIRELPFFSFSTILKVTDDFAAKNKFGEGGFGPEYKGKLEDGQDTAVKRLSKTSSQGVEELKMK
ncbi:hypothetical protein AAHA92_02767 [Salvia divinorum]|uniref:Apple domain-containing protein n=1 Tax=Salvia divinorum TaxID=28513 RepID=A0ABD1IG04_SALDI